MTIPSDGTECQPQTCAACKLPFNQDEGRYWTNKRRGPHHIKCLADDDGDAPELPGDSTEYELLTEAARRTEVSGLVCEIGTRLGGGIQAIIDGLTSPRAIVSVDPYGDIPYHYSDAHGVKYQMGYDQAMLVAALGSIPAACQSKGHLWIPILLEDSEFYRRYADGVPVYDAQKQVANYYALAHIDGPHDSKSLLAAVEFFLPRIRIGGAIVFDNIEHFKWDVVDAILVSEWGDCEARGQTKAVYRRTKVD